MRERVEDLGRLQEKLNKILEMDIFDDHRFLSKHNEKEWCPSYQEKWKENREGLIEFLEDKLDDCRRKFFCIQDRLYECYEIAKGDDGK